MTPAKTTIAAPLEIVRKATQVTVSTSHAHGYEPGGSIVGHIWAAIGATLVLGVICCGLYPLAVYAIAQLCFPIQANGSLITREGKPTTDEALAVGSSLIGQRFTGPGYFRPRPSAANNSAGSSYNPSGGYDASNSSGTNFGPLSDELINGLTAAPPAAPAPATQPAATAAPTTQPAEILAYDGIRLRVIHYALDNAIAFKLYNVTYDDRGEVASRKELPRAEFLAKFGNTDGTLNDTAFVDAFPHGDPAGKTVLEAGDFGTLIPGDAVTASGSGLDPHISPRNALLQAPRVAKERGLALDRVETLISEATDKPAFGVLGDPGVNLLRLNLALDKARPMPVAAAH
jgi:K+-transporting ATPase ATPase C chain